MVVAGSDMYREPNDNSDLNLGKPAVEDGRHGHGAGNRRNVLMAGQLKRSACRDTSGRQRESALMRLGQSRTVTYLEIDRGRVLYSHPHETGF